MRNFLIANRIFYLLFSISVIIAGIYLLKNDKGAFSLWLNIRHNPQADLFFRYATWLGDGITISIICVLLLLVQYRVAIVTAIVSFVSSFITVIIKNIFNHDRPVIYFKDTVLNFVDGIHLYEHYSFPSGHTAAAFALCCTLGFFVVNKRWQALFFMIALIVAVSRVYLFQHFAEDAFAGAIIGTFNATWICFILSRMKWISNSSWSENSLLKKRTASLQPKK